MAEEKKFASNQDIKTAVLEVLKADGLTSTADINAKIIELSKLCPTADKARYTNIWSQAYKTLMAQHKLPEDALPPKGVGDGPAKKTAEQKAREAAEKAASQVVLTDPTEQAIQAQLADRLAAQRDVSDKSVILKIIKDHPDIAELVIDAHPTFVYNQESAPQKMQDMEAEREYLDQDPENIANFEKLYKAVAEGTPVEALTSTKSNAWIGLQIQVAGGQTKIFKKDTTLRDFLIFDTAGYVNVNDKERLGVKLKKAKARNNANGQSQSEVQTLVTLVNRNAIKGKESNWYVTAYVVDKSKNERVARSARSVLSYRVLATAKTADGGREIKKNKKGEQYYRTARLTGQVDCRPLMPSPQYYIDAFAKQQGKGKGGSKQSLGQNELKDILALRAKEIVKTQKDKVEMEISGSLTPELKERLQSFNFGATGVDNGDQI